MSARFVIPGRASANLDVQLHIGNPEVIGARFRVRATRAPE